MQKNFLVGTGCYLVPRTHEIGFFFYMSLRGLRTKKTELSMQQLTLHSSLHRGFQPVVRGPPWVRGELPRGPRATPEKLETRRILTKQNTGRINVVGTGYNVQN